MAVVVELPPDADVPHHRSVFEPVGVALNGSVAAPWQYIKGVFTVGALGLLFTVTVMAASVLSQPLMVWLTL